MAPGTYPLRSKIREVPPQIRISGVTPKAFAKDVKCRPLGTNAADLDSRRDLREWPITQIEGFTVASPLKEASFVRTPYLASQKRLNLAIRHRIG